MTEKQRQYQVSLLRRLHTSPRYLNVYKDDPILYRAWLKKQLGVDSSKALRLDTLKALVEYFEMKSDEPPSNYATRQQVGYIMHLWGVHASTPTDAALLKFVHRTIGRETQTIEKITPKEASQIVAGIKKLKPNKITSENNTTYQGG